MNTVHHGVQVSALKVAYLLIPAHERVALRFRFCKFSVAPFRREYKLDIIEQEVGERAPPFGPSQLLADRDDSVAVILA